MQKNNLLLTASILGALAVIIGAFGAHGLKPRIAPDQLEIFKTGVDYHFYHTIALLATAVLYQVTQNRKLIWTGRLFLIGILLFSGSLYLLSTRALTGIESTAILGPATPLGGLFFIAGWISLVVFALQTQRAISSQK